MRSKFQPLSSKNAEKNLSIWLSDIIQSARKFAENDLNFEIGCQ